MIKIPAPSVCCMDNTVFCASCPDYRQAAVDAAVKRILDYYGGAAAFLQKGRRVVLKPNLLLARTPDTATTTHPALVEAVAKAFVAAGAQVVIAESSGGPYHAAAMNRAYAACGMTGAAERSGAVLNQDFSHRRVRYDGAQPRSFELITPLCQADVIISLAKMKTHMLTRYTGAVKNLFGSIAGLNKAAWHSRLPDITDFCQMLVDLCQCVHPDLSIIDGIEGMDGKGPSGGRVRQVGMLVASVSPYAADLAAMHLCGIEPEKAPLHQAAVGRGLVPGTFSHLETAGDPITPLKEPFVPPTRLRHSHSMLNYLPLFLRRPLQRRLVPYPVFSDRCVGCGRCAQACPRQAITVTAGRAVLDQSRCIQCYCCHELCPVRAVEVKD